MSCRPVKSSIKAHFGEKLPQQDPSHRIPSFPRAHSRPIPSCSEIFRTAAPSFYLLEAPSRTGQDLSSSNSWREAWSHSSGAWPSKEVGRGASLPGLEPPNLGA